MKVSFKLKDDGVNLLDVSHAFDVRRARVKVSTNVLVNTTHVHLIPPSSVKVITSAGKQTPKDLMDDL